MFLDDAKLELEEDVFNELIKNRVIYTDDEYVFIRFLDDQYSEVEKTSNKGKLYALKRWKPEEYNKIMGIDTDKVPNGLFMGTHKEPNAEEKREEEIREEKKRREKKFAPPKLLDVVDYFIEKGYTPESAKKAFEYYELGDWKDSSGKKVKNWKQKMNGVWFKPENKVKPIDRGAKF
jgi:hypothetical protein